MEATDRGNIAAVKLLLNAGATIDIQSKVITATQVGEINLQSQCPQLHCEELESFNS